MSTCEYKILARELKNNKNITTVNGDLTSDQLMTFINLMMAQRDADGFCEVSPNSLFISPYMYADSLFLLNGDNLARMSGMIKHIVVVTDLPENQWYLSQVPTDGKSLPSEEDMVRFFEENPHMVVRSIASGKHAVPDHSTIAKFMSLP